MRRFQPFSAVVEALKESDILEVVDDDTAVRRKVPLANADSLHEVQKVFEDAAMARSVYVKGFGPEGPSTQFDIEAWFSNFGPTNQVRLRRTQDKSFKGSVFVEFDSEETAKKFLATDPAPKYNGRELIFKSKKQYCDEKVEDIKAGKVKPNESHKRDDRDWRDRKEQDRKRGFPPVGGRGRKGFGSKGGRDRDDHKRRRRDEDGEDGEDERDNKKRSRDEEDGAEEPVSKKAAVESEAADKPTASPVEDNTETEA
jgi:lupus La protein